MNMKAFRRISLAALSSFAIILSSFAFSQASSSVGTRAEGEEDPSYTVVKADVSQFRSTNGGASCTIDEENETVSTTGGWESGFLSTNQFDTMTGSYYLKAHVSGTIEDSPDSASGFNLYFNNENFLNFYLHWMSGNWTGSIASAVFLVHVDGQYQNAYESAILPNGVFQLRGNFTDCWTDYGGWTVGEDRDGGASVNLRTEGSVILLKKGFDITLYVDRTTYRERLVDVMQLRVDAYAGDGTTPMSFFTPKYAVDAYTCPKGVESPYAQTKPLIGFWNYNAGNVTYSNIEFGHKPYEKQSTATFSSVGMDPKKAQVRNDDNSIAYENENFNTGFYLADNVTLPSPRADFRAHAKGSIGDVAKATIGYSFYYDPKNYLLLFLQWDGTSGTVDGFHVLATVDGETKNVYQGARNPWDAFATISEFKDMWSDHDGFITDCEVPCGIDDNFNHFRSESAITLETGFDVGVIRSRSVFRSKTVDNYQMYVVAEGKDGKTHTWYTPLWCMDAFTYPNGREEASPWIDKTPTLGLYSYQAGEIAFTDLRLNGASLLPKNISTLEFGSREENGWTMSGSNLGGNWALTENALSESWDELPKDSHRGEVNSLKSNEIASSYMSATFVLSRSFSEESYVGAYPYYVDEDNYLLAYFSQSGGEAAFCVSGKLRGEDLGGVSSLLRAPCGEDLSQGVLLEIGVEGNRVDFYLGQTPKPTYSFAFEKQKFGERALSGASAGFTFYNASGSIKDFALGSDVRIHPYAPTENDVPKIYAFGTKSTSGYVGHSFTLPTYVAFNYLHEAVDVEISICKEDGALVQTLEKGVYEFTVDEAGTYIVKVNATDEWGHSAEQIAYKVNFVKYLGPGESEPKEVLWQTIVVLCFFGGILLITAFCGVVLARKNKKEALKAAELNRKNHERNLRDLEDE